VLTDGLPQYEVRPDGTVLVTVLRGFGELSRADLPERPGHAGWPTPTPEAQCPGPFAARLAVLLDEPGVIDAPGAIESAADAFLAAPVALMRRALLGRPAVVPGPELLGEGLVFSAMKPAVSGRGVVLRCYNARAVAVRGTWRVPWPVRSAARCRLDEAPLERLRIADGEIAFDAAPRAVVTVLLR
jgi:alpha-mannosidase